MKNKVGIPHNTVKNMQKPIASDIYNTFLSRIAPIKAVSATVLIKTTKILGTLVVTSNSLLSLFKKVVSLTKIVLEQCLTSNGTPIIVSQNIKDVPYENSCFDFPTPVLIPVSNDPVVIPNQKIKFHNLSLVSHLALAGWLGNLLLVKLSPTTFLAKLAPIKLPYSRLISSSFLRIVIMNPTNDQGSYRTIISNIYLFTKQIVLMLSSIIFLGLPNMSYSATPTTGYETLELIRQEERVNNIPPNLLLSVVKIESQLQPLALNIAGRTILPKNKDDALKVINQALKKGITNIDIGLAQVNYKWHHHNFTSLEDMLSPEVNIKYAAELLAKLKQDYGDWQTAIRLYHSARPKYYRQYSRKVVLCWLGIKQKM